MEIPKECGNSKWSTDEKTQVVATAKLAAPNFKTIKNNVDRLEKRLNDIKNNPKFKEIPPPVAMMREYQQLLKKRNNFIEDLRDHPNFEAFEQEVASKKKDVEGNLKSIDKLTPEERENFMKKWRKMSSPKKSQLLAALSNINHALAAIVNDRFWCKNSYRKRRYKELILYRNQICKKLLKYQPERSESFECFQFRPCKLKIVKIWEYAKKNKRGDIARFLKFDFDEDLNRLGMPKKSLIDDAIRKYENFMAQLDFQINEDLVETEEEKMKRIEKLTQEKEICERRKIYLTELRNKIEPPKLDEVKEEEENQFPPAGYWRGTVQNDFQNHLELPPRHKLEAVLMYQQNLLANIERIDGIKSGPKGKTNKAEKEQSQATSKGARGINKSQTDEVDKNFSEEPEAQQVDNQKVGNLMMFGDSSEELVQPQNEPIKPSSSGGNRMILGGSDESFVAYQKGERKPSIKRESIKDEVPQEPSDNETPKAPSAPSRNPTAIRSLKDGLISNIKYIKKCLDNYPETAIKLHICKPEPSLENVEKKQFNVQNEAGTETFSLPKYNILLASREKYDEMLKKFESDVGNKDAIEAYSMTNEGEDDEGFISDENNKGTSMEPPVKQEKIQSVKSLPQKSVERKKKKDDLESRVETYKRLKEGKKRVEELIRKQEERLEKMNSEGKTSGPSLFSHNKVCKKIDEEEEKPQKEYKLTGPRKDIYIATEARMRAALDKHLEWIEERLKRVGSQREEIIRMLKNLESGRSALDDGNENESEEEIIAPEAEKKAKKFKFRKDRKASRVEKDTLMHLTINPSQVTTNEPLQEQIVQQKQSSSRKLKEETLKAITPFLVRYLRHKFTLQHYLEQVENAKLSSLHADSHKNADSPEKTFFDFSKKGTADLKYIEALARPKQVCLQSTLEKFSKFMCDDKQERIKCQMNLQRKILRPEELEDIVRSVEKPKRKIQNRTAKIKCELSKQIYDQLAKVLKKKIAKEMTRATAKKPKAISQPFRELEKTIFMLLMSINGIPRSHRECEMYNNFTSVIMAFLMNALQENSKE